MSDSTNNQTADAIEEKFDRIDELVSLLVDEHISDNEFRELEGMLQTDEYNRRRYIDGIQLHVDLLEYYHPGRENVVGKPDSPILTMLGKPLPGSAEDSGLHLGVQPPKSNG